MIRFLSRLRRDNRGVTLVEFALVAPTMLVMLLATFDLAYRAYITSVLQGVVQKAGRDGALENGSGGTASLNATVKNTVYPLVVNGSWTFTRKNYVSFTRAGQQEKFTDNNSDGMRNAGECFEDENGNGSWDSDSGASGNGGARDIVIFTAKVAYPRIIPMYGLKGWSSTQEISATTVLRNQPYAEQAARTTTVVCT